MSDLIERLRAASAAMRSHYAVGAVELIPTWTMDEAAKEIERLTAEIEWLREALQVCADAPMSGWTIAQGYASKALGGEHER